MQSGQVVRVYIYEALAIVISSVLIGFVIGDLVSITLTLQTTLFTELPYQFEFPTLLFFAITIMSITVAVLGSYFPARSLLNKRIASALKGA